MNYLIVYTQNNQANSKTIFIDKFEDLVAVVEKLEKSGKGVKVDIYEATKKTYKIEYDNVSKMINVKVPKIVIT